MKPRYKAIMAAAAAIILLGWAGRMDYTEEVIYNMPNEAYSQIKERLGEGASDYEIAEFYIENYK